MLIYILLTLFVIAFGAQIVIFLMEASMKLMEKPKSQSEQDH